MIKHFGLALILFAFDRLSKTYIIQNPSLGQSQDGFLSLHINKDMAFSLPMIDFVVYPLIAVILVVLVWWWQRSWQQKSILIWPIALLIIGAISNLIDRIKYGGVVDFISVPYFTVFNISDIYISIGVAWLLWQSWFGGKLDKSLRQD